MEYGKISVKFCLDLRSKGLEFFETKETLNLVSIV